MVERPIDEFVGRIPEAFQPLRIVLFGSRARHDARPDSDLELTTEMASDDPPAQQAGAIGALSGPRRWATDLLVYTPQEVQPQQQYRNSLIGVIDCGDKVLYRRPGRPRVVDRQGGERPALRLQ